MLWFVLFDLHVVMFFMMGKRLLLLLCDTCNNVLHDRKETDRPG